MTLFDADFLPKLDQLSLVSRRAAHGQLLAKRTARHRGSGLEFADHREYQPGDDFRYLDWNVYARHGELLLKRFHEERDLRVDFVLDCSRSMEAGDTEVKFDHARRIAACLVAIALTQLDRVSLVSFADGVVDQLPVARGKHQLLSLLRRMEELQTSGRDTDIEASIKTLLTTSQSGGLAIVISDFLDLRGWQRGLDRLRYHQYEVYLVHLIDECDSTPKLLGDFEIVDMETGQQRTITVRERDLERYRQAFQRFQAAIVDYAQHHSMGYLPAPTHMSYDELILQSMRRAGWLVGTTH